MQKYRNNVADVLGNSVASFRITVYLGGTGQTTLATIYEDDGVTPLSNPFDVESERGDFEFYAANGRFDYKISNIAGGGDDILVEDVSLFDFDDVTIDSGDLSDFDLSGAANGDLLVWQSGQVIPQTALEAGLDSLFARVNAATSGYIWPRAATAGSDAAFEVTQQSTGRIANFRSGAGAGSVVAYIEADGSATFSGDLVVLGDFTVTGTVTQVDSNAVNIGDNIIVLNADEAGTPTQNAGFEVERGTSTNSTILWNETTDRFVAGLVGSTQTLALLEANETVAGTWSFSNALTVGNASAGGHAVNRTTGDGRYARLTGSTFTGIVIVDTDSDGAVQIHLSETPSAGGWARGFQVHRDTSGLNFGTGLFGNAGTAIYAYMGIGTNPHATSIRVYPDGTFEAPANVVLGATSGNTLTINGTAVSIPNGLTLTGGTVTVAGDFSARSGKFVVTESGSNVRINNPSGNITIQTGGTSRATIDSVSLTLSQTTASSSSSTGALVVTGGVGIGGALNVGGSINGGEVRIVHARPFVRMTESDQVSGEQAWELVANGKTLGLRSWTDDFATTSRDILTAVRGAGVVISSIAIGNSTDNPPVTIPGTTASSSSSTGALVVAGGVGIGGAMFVGGNVTMNSTTAILAVGSNTATAPFMRVNGAAGNARGFLLQTAGLNRWSFLANTGAESGSDAGTQFSLNAHNDAGTTIDSPLSITRASGGAITIGGSTARVTEFTGAVQMADNELRRPLLTDYAEKTQSITSTATTTINCESGNSIDLQHTVDITTLNLTNPPASGRTGAITIFRTKDNSGTTRSITWPASVKWSGGTAPVLTQTALALDIITLVTKDGGTTWVGSYLLDVR